MTTYFYGRNSDVESFDKGSSITTQLEKCKSYAVLKDLKIDVEVTEQTSGAILFNSRVKGYELMQKLKKGDNIICLEISRFSRNTLDLLQLVKKFKRMGVKLHFTDIGEVTGSDAVGSVTLTLLSSFAQFYRDQISEKSKNTKTRMRKENRYCGGKIPFGFEVNESGYLIPLEKELKVIKRMRLMRSEGKTFQYISDELTRSTRKKFPISWIHKILNRECIDSMVVSQVAHG
jgi:putative DNA-invertase from lambdoid prophage Rac